MAIRFCEEIVKGRSVNDLCATDEFPSQNTIYRWFRENEDFREKYSRARELQADILADEVIPIVNGERPVLNIDGVEIPNLDTWIAGKIKGREYKMPSAGS